MPGVYLEFIKAGKYVVPVELAFQTETIKAPTDIRGLVTTSKWIERHNWKEIKAMLKPAVEACLKYNDTPLDEIPKSHSISYGRDVSLGYLIIPNKVSTPFLSILSPRKNVWTDDEDDEDELLGLKPQEEKEELEDLGAEFTECIPTKTAIRVSVVRKSVVSIDDARRIRKELGVRSDEVRQYFSSAAATAHLSSSIEGSSSMSLNFPENNHLNHQQTERNLQSLGGQPSASARPERSRSRSTDSETENIPRTFGDIDEIKNASRIYPHVINRDIDSGEDPDDDLSLPDIEPTPPKRKKEPAKRKKSASPTKSKRLTHSNILSVSQEGQTNFSEEETGTSNKKSKRPKRKRTVAVVEPMRTLANGRMSFEQAIGALGTEKRRKPRAGSCADKSHSGGRSKQTPAIDIIAPDDDRLTITSPPEPLLDPELMFTPIAIPSPPKETERVPSLSAEKRDERTLKRRQVHIDDDPHKYERLTPSPLFDDNDDIDVDDDEDYPSSDSENDMPMPVLHKMVDSNEEDEEKSKEKEKVPNTNPIPQITQVDKDKEKTEEKSPNKSKNQNEQSSPDITQTKTKSTRSRSPRSPVRKLKFVEDEAEKSKEDNTTPKQSTSKDTLAKLNSDQRNSSAESGTPTKSPKSPVSPKKVQALQKSPVTNGKIELEKSTEEEGKNVKKKRIYRKKKKQQDPEKVKPDKPRMSDAQSQTDDLLIVEEMQPRKLISPCRGSPVIKISRSCEVSSEDELSDGTSSSSSEQSESPTSESESGQLSLSLSMYHPALGSPNRDFVDDDGLFSFESPTLPEVSSALVCIDEAQSPEEFTEIAIIDHGSTKNPVVEINLEEHVQEDVEEETQTAKENVLEEEVLVQDQDDDKNGNKNDSEDFIPPPEPGLSHEIIRRPESPLPGCSHWSLPMPVQRQSSPPPPALTSSILMPPPTSRPPRTPRKFTGTLDEPPPPRLSICSPDYIPSSELESQFQNSQETQSNEEEHMPVGTEATDIAAPHGNIYEVLKQPEVFKTGMKLIEKVKKKPSAVNAIERKLNLSDSDPQSSVAVGVQTNESRALVPVSSASSATNKPKRDLSPDICDTSKKRLCVVITSRSHRSRRDTHEEAERNANSEETQTENHGAVVLRRNTDDEMSDVETSVSVMEYYQRGQTSQREDYQPQGDEFDLSQRSYCMLSVVPQYDLKSRLYKIHAKAVGETPIKELIQHFHSIRSELFGIFQGKVYSKRHKIFIQGFDAKRQLRDLNVTMPYTTAQCSSLSTLIFDNLVPEVSLRCEYMDYVTLVLLPETLIRIFTRINNVSYEMAETEMSYRACYDGEVPPEYHPPGPPAIK